MIAYTGVMEKIMLLDEKPRFITFEFHGFTIKLSYRETIHDAGDTAYTVYALTLQNNNLSEQTHLVMALHQNKDADITAMVAPAEIADDPAFTLSDLQSWRTHPLVMNMDLAAIFEESKALLAKHFLDQLSQDTRHRYTAWIDRNEKILASLCSLNFSIPDYVVAPIAYILSDEWNVTVNALEVYGEEDVVYTRLLELWKKVEKYNVKIDFTQSTRLLEELLSGELTLFSASLSDATSSRMSAMLTIVDKFGIPVAKNKVEEGFYEILTGPIRHVYETFKNNPEKSTQDQASIQSLLNFARRMNFNTDDFPLVLS